MGPKLLQGLFLWKQGKQGLSEVYIPIMVPVNFYASHKLHHQLVAWHGNCSIFNILGITELWMDGF